jgi:hypothetical protein
MNVHTLASREAARDRGLDGAVSGCWGTSLFGGGDAVADKAVCVESVVVDFAADFGVVMVILFSWLSSTTLFLGVGIAGLGRGVPTTSFTVVKSKCGCQLRRLASLSLTE